MVIPVVQVVLRSSDLRPFGRGKLVQGMRRLGVGVLGEPLPRIGLLPDERRVTVRGPENRYCQGMLAR